MATPFEQLVEVMRRLRGEGGCPWDRQQTRESLTPFLLEETHEVLEAIEEGEPSRLKEELGDLLLQVVFHAQLAAEAGEFGMSEIIGTTVEKLIRRHPHVFGGEEVGTAGEVLARWEKIKRAEAGTSGRPSALDGVPRTLPALLRAHQVQAKAARVGVDWRELAPVKAKVLEEWGELMTAVETQSRARQEAELGDLLFAAVNLSRWLRIDPEEALQRATRRFLDRFRHMERIAEGEGRPLAGRPPEELDRLWEQAKRDSSP
jgi:tetrapyrrole methylase family protein/MazG family protein